MSTNSKLLRTVIVEDSEAFLMRLRLALKSCPQLEVVGFAESSSGAIRLLDQTKPDIVLLDLYLKEGSGVDVLRYILQHGLKIKTLVMTSEQSWELRSACVSLGASRFHDKADVIATLSEDIEAMAQELSEA